MKNSSSPKESGVVMDINRKEVAEWNGTYLPYWGAMFFACTALAGEKIHWGYEADNGPSHWGELNPDWMLCAGGHHQSPIDLTGAKQEKLEQMKLNILLANLRIVHKKDVR